MAPPARATASPADDVAAVRHRRTPRRGVPRSVPRGIGERHRREVQQCDRACAGRCRGRECEDRTAQRQVDHCRAAAQSRLAVEPGEQTRVRRALHDEAGRVVVRAGVDVVRARSDGDVAGLRRGPSPDPSLCRTPRWGPGAARPERPAWEGVGDGARGPARNGAAGAQQDGQDERPDNKKWD